MNSVAQVSSPPVASVVLSDWGDEADAHATIHSVLRQTLSSLELIIPAHAPFALAYAAEDPRVVVGDPASLARGKWIGFVRGGEVMHAERLRRLIDAGDRNCADMIVDDLLSFDGLKDSAPVARFHGAYARGSVRLTRKLLEQDATVFSDLSPMFRRTLVADCIKDGRGALLSILINAEAHTLTYPLPLLFQYAPRNNERGKNAKKRAVLLSRQRIVGATSGASTYVLSVARALKSAGFGVDYLGISPTLFGRWPVLRLRPETRVFDTFAVRRGVRFGDWIWATDPMVTINAAIATFMALLRACGLGVQGWPRPPTWSIAAAAERADMLFVANKVRGRADLVLCDYAFLAPMAAYALAPQAASAVIMHDLWSAPVDADGAANDQPIVRLDRSTELDLLGQADAAIAIQSEEASLVRPALKRTRTIVAPCAMQPVERAQTGVNGRVLFVGSNTTHNLRGLQWFLRHCWDDIRAVHPNARLVVAGAVRRGVGGPLRPGVELRGVVDDLPSLYAEAGVVVAPLRAGSGLKIKLIEAMAAGKAVVATSVAARGVEEVLFGALSVEDDPARFTRAVLDLLDNPERREALGEAALTAIRRDFSEHACYNEFVQFALSSFEQRNVMLGAGSEVGQAGRFAKLNVGLL